MDSEASKFEFELRSEMMDDNKSLLRRSRETRSYALDTTEHKEGSDTDFSSGEDNVSVPGKRLIKPFSDSVLHEKSNGADLSNIVGATQTPRFSADDVIHQRPRRSIWETVADEVREFKLMIFAALPQWLQKNDFLHGSHRPPMPCFNSCFRSVFSLHSETVNIWTHLIGSFIFLTKTLLFFLRPSSVPYTQRDNMLFMAYFVSVVMCMTFSWLYHAVLCHSEKMYRLFSRLDYCGIAVFMLGTVVSWLYYAFYCREHLMTLYICSFVCLWFYCLYLCCSEKFAKPDGRGIRTLTFFCTGVFTIIPFVHALWNYDLETMHYVGHLTSAFLTAAGGLIYSMRVPERFFPGKVDVWGHGHQIMHVLAVIGALVHCNTIIDMAEYRHTFGQCDLWC